MTTLYIDTETRGKANLPKVGSYAYFAAGAKAILLQWAVNAGKITVAEPDAENIKLLQAAIYQSDEIVFHNASFDRLALTTIGIDAPLEKTHCTMAQAAMHSLPGALGKLCEILNVPIEQSKASRKYGHMRTFCLPKVDGTFNDKTTHPKQWGDFLHYAGQDVIATREIYKRLPKSNLALERPVWLADQLMNARGFKVDTELCFEVMKLVEAERAAGRRSTQELTSGALDSTTQGAKLLQYVSLLDGVELTDLKEATLLKALNSKELSDSSRQLIEERLQSASASAAKYLAAVEHASPDGRLRGSMLYCGARRTRRWSGKGLQPQNFARPHLPHREIEDMCEGIRVGAFETVRDPALTAVEYAKQCVRGIIVAAKGCKLVVADLANVESRVGAWLAGSQDKLQAYRDFDAGKGPDLYKLGYARTFGIPVEKVTKEGRSLSKVIELASQYGGGAAAMLGACATYRMEPSRLAEAAWNSISDAMKEEAGDHLRDKEANEALKAVPEEVYVACWSLVRMWRRSALNAPIAKMWADLNHAAIRCVLTGEQQIVGKVAFDLPQPAWLRLRLPSGRFLMYARPKVAEGSKLSFEGIYKGGPWIRQSVWGGQFYADATQSTARDILAEAVVDVERDGGCPVLSVHDELICEVSKDSDWNVTRLSQYLTRARSWTIDLPLAAEGYEATRYRKG